MNGGQSGQATTPAPPTHHDDLPPPLHPPKPLSSRVLPSSWTWKLCAAFTVVSLQIVLSIDSGISFSFTTPPSDRLPLASGPASITIDPGTGRPLARTLPGAVKLREFLSPGAAAPTGASVIRIGEQAIAPAGDLRSRIASCLVEPPAPPAGSGEVMAGYGGAMASTTMAPGKAGLSADTEPSPVVDTRGSTNCALLVGLLLLGASEPALRYRGGGFRGPVSLP